MDKAIYLILALAAAGASYFWGQQSGMDKALKVERQQQALSNVQTLSQQAQYLTLLDLGKTDELSMLIKSRLLSTKTQLQMQLSNPDLNNKKMLQQAIRTADGILVAQPE